MTQDEGWVPLSRAIRTLRSELSIAMAAAKGQELQFRLGPVELEFQLGVTRERDGEAGIRFWVVTLGAKGSQSKAQTHTVRLTLVPHLASDPAADVNVDAQGQIGD